MRGVVRVQAWLNLDQVFLQWGTTSRRFSTSAASGFKGPPDHDDKRETLRRCDPSSRKALLALKCLARS